MKQILGAFAVVFAVAALVGCTAAADPPDPAAVQEWLSQQSKPVEDVSQMAGLASKTADVEAADHAGDRDGVRIDMDEPSRISAIEFSCFGAESMTASVLITAGSASIGDVVEKVPCAEGPIDLDLSAVDGLPVSSVSANGYNDAGFGAWSVTVR